MDKGMWLILALAIGSCGACTTLESSTVESSATLYPAASAPELLVGLFKEGRPHAGDRLSDAVTDPDFTLSALARDADIINRFTDFEFQISGTTDNRECAAQECIELSLRRARLVYEWLVAHGVQETRLKPPIGRGDQVPLTDNSTETERSVNRRVIIDFVF